MQMVFTILTVNLALWNKHRRLVSRIVHRVPCAFLYARKDSGRVQGPTSQRGRSKAHMIQQRVIGIGMGN